ncbi:hypothetical protein G4B88_019294 [Cannabis sativa]|uniref:Proteasome alpha-type subunits domain-containing protein n=1 Tax=Cannabis sativa TaxID=3483 RepID=A0A7J6DVM6_CANSA|nr:hypothetical protein G4B88_019294 [Cannabis sativa]
MAYREPLPRCQFGKSTSTHIEAPSLSLEGRSEMEELELAFVCFGASELMKRRRLEEVRVQRWLWRRRMSGTEEEEEITVGGGGYNGCGGGMWKMWILPSICFFRTEYDRGVNTFSPEGRLFQVEYAIEAIKLGSTAIGLKTKEGVVLAVEKRITSPLLEPSSVEKIMEVDEHIGCAMSGLIADARTLVEHARVETQNHRFSYGEPMTVESTTQALCDLALRFGEGDEESMSRPFGVSLLIAGHDENGPSLYYTDPSGTFWQCNAKAIGSGSEGADSSLQEQFNKDLTLKEAETIALSILKQVMEEKVTPNNVDIAKVAPTYHLYTPSEVEAVITRL